MRVMRAADVSAPAETRVYSTGAAAKLCGVSIQTVTRLFDEGALGGYRVPGSRFRRISRAALLTFMVEHGIPTDGLGELSAEEREQVARKVGGPRVIQTKLPAPDRLNGVA